MSPLDTLRPRLRPDLLVSRPLLCGPTRIHLLLDPGTGAQLAVTPKTRFVIDQLDGSRSLTEVGEAYADRFGSRLGEPQWRQLLDLLHERCLLAGAAPPPVARRVERQTVLAGRLPLVANTPALIERLHRATGFARRRSVLVPVLLLIAAMLVDLTRHLPALVTGTAALSHRPLALAGVAGALWLSMALHELAHGLVARAAGGTVTELGLRWRLPTAYLYCTVADLRFLPSRGWQLATAGAGALANLAVLLPVYLVWVLLGAGAHAHPVLDGLLLLGTLAGLVNLLPLPPLDGYKLLEYLLGTAQLAAESRRFARLSAGRLLRRGPGVARYPSRARLVLGGYALGWAVLTGALAWAFVRCCLRRLPVDGAVERPAPALVAVAVLSVLAVLPLLRRRTARADER